MQIKRRKHNKVIAASAEKRNDIMSEFMESQQKSRSQSEPGTSELVRAMNYIIPQHNYIISFIENCGCRTSHV